MDHTNLALPSMAQTTFVSLGTEQMTLNIQEHCDLMAMFEREYKGARLDYEDKAMWPKGHIYQNGETNNLFLAYRKGCAYGRAVEAGKHPPDADYANQVLKAVAASVRR